MNRHTGTSIRNCFLSDLKSTLAPQLHRRQQTIFSESRGSVHLHTCKTSPVVDEMVRRMEPISGLSQPCDPESVAPLRAMPETAWKIHRDRAAACSHNPRFGQETSAAAVSVKILNDSLAKYGVGDPRLPTGSFLSRRVIAAAAARGPRRPSTHTPSPC